MYECIIIDSSPIGTVSDTFHLFNMVNASVLIVRQNMTLKDQLENTIKEIKISDIESINIVVNDLEPDDKRYYYGSKYKYYSSKEKSTLGKVKGKMSIGNQIHKLIDFLHIPRSNRE